jgi:FkbM family methyltransferase
MSIRPERQTPVSHPWLRRVMRTVEFGFARMKNPTGYVEARAAAFDLKFRGPSADCIVRHIYRLGAHEPHISRWVIEHIRLGSGDIAIDVGANLGWYSVLLSRLSEPGARIFAFEPDPENYQLLCDNVRANSATAVTAVNGALGESAGTAILHRYKRCNVGRHSLVPGSNAGGEECEVSVQTLDSFCLSRGIGDARVRFLKIDVEGFEYEVARGAADLLRRCDYALVEFNQGGGSEASLLKLIAESGLTTSAFIDGSSTPVPMTSTAILESGVQLDLLLTPAHSPG